MNFRTQFSERVRVVSNPGDPIKEVKGPVLDRYGNKVIVTKDKIDLYAAIQAYRDDCDLNILMAKFTNGDRTALMQRVGAYLDLSTLPDNYNDMMNLTTSAQSVFDSLPIQIKEMFGNNVTNFLANSRTKEFNEIMSKSPEQLRLEKVMHSDQFSKNSRDESVPDKLKPVVENPAVDEPIGPIEKESLSDQVNNLVYGKVNLNVSK